MKIDKIELCNFGSYTGITKFDISGQNNKNGRVVLIGGKNGAGKTTLFSGLKLCVYGYRASGFQNPNAFYRKEVKKFFNDAARFDLDASCYVATTIRMSNGQEYDEYLIKRSWNVFSEKLEEFEEFEVVKNHQSLTDDEMADFDNYLLNIIPPELFDLFFFDGEQIADYFLGENGSETVKNAFMILCGYDVFDIIQKNFKRIAYGKSKADADGSDYISAKSSVDELLDKITSLSDEIRSLQVEIDSAKHEIVALDKTYRRSGGVLKDQWNKKFLALKEEERLREEKNGMLKKYANEIIPFLIVKDVLLKLQRQISVEQDKQKLAILQESLVSLLPEIMDRVCKKTGRPQDDGFTSLVIEELRTAADKDKQLDVDNILNLSNEESISLQATILRLLMVKKEEIIETEREISESIQRSQLLRDEIEHSNVEGESDYLAERNSLEKEIEHKQSKKEKVQSLLQDANENYKEDLANLKRVEKKLDEELKAKSITDLSQKSVAFLDELQKRLYKSEIKKVEVAFMRKIKELARKKNFIDKITIDDSFNVHIYKNANFELSAVCDKLKLIGEEKYISEYGIEHVKSILTVSKCDDLKALQDKYSMEKKDVIALQEIEKSRLSKGEKQVFIMALYWALVQLSNHEVPFVIDTPFARIDSEHRANITKKFFMDLKGQVFIFSTNEEIIGENYNAMKDVVQAKFLLENVDNISTTVIANKYFGE